MTSVLSNSDITEAQFRRLAIDFYAKIDSHAPLEDFLSILAIGDSGFKIALPGVDLVDKDSTTSWYNRMVHGYFDGSHLIYSVDLTSSSPTLAEAKVVLLWTASVWKAPSHKSENVNILTYTTWTIKSSNSNSLRVLAYAIDRLDYAPGTLQQTPH